MSELIGKKAEAGRESATAAGALSQDDVQQKQKKACAGHEQAQTDPIVDGEIPPKKRKTRRGKSKRRHPYIKNRIRKSVCKPEAPHNSNQFLLADHGDMEQLAEDLRHIDRVSTSTAARTRDSSFSQDSDAEFYSSPDDEEEYLIRDFDDQYESLQVERLNALSKDELIREFLVLENRVESLSKRLRKRYGGTGDLDQVQEVESSEATAAGAATPAATPGGEDLRGEMERLGAENEALRRENELLRAKVSSVSCSSGSADSETDSSDSCSSSSSNSSSSSSSASATVGGRGASAGGSRRSAGSSPAVVEERAEPEGMDYSRLNGLGEQTPPSVDSAA